VVKPVRDPEGEELKHLTAACDLTGKTVLEIGCGDGRFTRQYAGMTSRVFGLDPLLSETRLASKGAKRNKAFFLQGHAEALSFPKQTFDIAIFASSL
jgi:ubiquinone/menaquinone biosynthesis C-methylase UbiE